MLLNALGAQWHHDRKLIAPTFHRPMVNKYAVIISEKTEILIQCLSKEIHKHSGHPIDICPFITKVAFDITYGKNYL